MNIRHLFKMILKWIAFLVFLFPVCASKVKHDQCGFREYSRLHRTASKRLISVAVEAGMADRLSGIITEFYWALLTDRAFYITSYEKLPNFDAAFDHNAINWNGYTVSDKLIEHLKFTYRGTRGFTGSRDLPDEVDRSEWASMYLVNTDPGFFCNQDLALLHNNVTNILVSSNRGRAFCLFNNVHHNEKLRALGLTATTMFRCAFDYLFSPNKATRQMMSSLKASWGVLSNRKFPKIGISIRTGDDVFKSKSILSWNSFPEFFSCAKQLESSMNLANVSWYLISDSLSVRKSASRHYGSKVKSDTETAFMHSDCEHHNRQFCDKQHMDLSFQQSATNLLLFRECRFHVVTANSGFGMLGAWLSTAENHIFMVHTGRERICSYQDYDPPQMLSMHWAGV